jgi:Fe-S cluster assembly protein SufD
VEAVATERDLVSASAETFGEIRLRREPEWLAGLREREFARFVELGPPAPKLESWKYTSAAPLARTAFRRAEPVPIAAVARAVGELRLPDSIELVFVNGRLSRELSTPAPLRPGLTVRSLGGALESDPSMIEPHLGRIAADGTEPFEALNAALFEDGAFVSIAPGTVVEQPIHLLFFSVGGRSPSALHPRNLIVAGAGSEATVVETWAGSAGDAPAWTNAATEIRCEDGAVFEHYKVEREAPSAFHVHSIRAEQGRSSRFVSHNVSVGGRLVRTDLAVRLAAEGADCVLNGLFYGTGARHVDNHTTIDHAMPHGTSRELYKGILDGRSRGVFYGKIIVRPDAQKTDAMQTNKNLLLSREALVNSTPALEIHADDVKCKHGSTIGQLDPDALFYLRSRGLGEADARALLLYAFAADLASRMRVAPVRRWLETFLGLRLAETGEAA